MHAAVYPLFGSNNELARGETCVIKLLLERELPASFDVTDDGQAAWHARVAVNSVAATAGKMHWLCTYATEDRKLFGLVVVESEEVLEEYVRRAGIGGSIKIHRVLRVLDPALAAPPSGSVVK
jgi:hypothetical protein